MIKHLNAHAGAEHAHSTHGQALAEYTVCIIIYDGLVLR